MNSGRATGALTALVMSLAVCGLAVCGLTVCGCDSGGLSSGRKVAAAPVQHPMLENIPLPADAIEQPERSVGRRSGRFRVGKFEFLTANDPLTVMRFYRELMPTAGYRLRTEVAEGGVYDMRFDSDVEECAIRIIPGRMSKTRLIVDVGPIPRGPAAAANEPDPAARVP
jgi:hypothetical protein